MKYHQHLNHSKKERFLQKTRNLLILVAVAMLCVAAYLFGDFQTGEPIEEEAISAPTSSYNAPDIQIFRSPYFQFQAGNSWKEDSGSSEEGKYVYRSLRNGLIDHQLIIYVNSRPDEDAVTRVLSTSLNGEQELRVEKISEHCGEATGNSSGKRQVMLDGVSFHCFTDDTKYTVLVGLKGGTTNIPMVRPDGSAATYTIYYTNVKAVPDAVELTNIVDSFQTR